MTSMTLQFFLGFVRLSSYMFVQNFIELRSRVNELSCVQLKNSAEMNSPSLPQYRADSKKPSTNTILSSLPRTVTS